jgi:phage-related protein
MDRVLQILITAKDQATNELKGLQGALERAEGASQAFALGLAGIVAVSGLCIKEYADSETAVTKLSHIMKTATNASDEQIKSLLDQADALQAVGVVADDTIISLQGQLATFNFTTDTIKALTPAILDVVVAEKGVNATTEDMISYGNAFGMAMEGNYASLTKRGFKLDDNTKSIIANGTETEKATAILKVLDSTYKGLNEKMTETSAGAMIRLNNQFKQLQQEVGKYLVPALIYLTTQLSNLMTQISPLIDKLPILFDWFSKNQTAIYVLAGAIVGGLTPAIWGAITAFASLAITLAPFIIGGAIIGALVAGIVWIVQNWEMISSRAIQIWDGIASYLTGIWNTITTGMMTVWNGVVSFFTALWEGVKTTFSFALYFIVGLVLTIFSSMGIDLFAVFNNIKIALGEFWSELTTFFSEKLTLIQTIWTSIWNIVGAVVGPVWNIIKNMAQAGLAWLQAKFIEYSAPITSAWTILWTGLGESVKTVWEGVKNFIKESINWVISKVNVVISAINSVVSTGALAFGKTAYQIPNIPMLANGGIVTGPTLAMVGEAGPEAIIPLNRAGGAMGITVNINGGYYLSEDVAENLGDLIIKRLKTQLAI